MNAIYLDYNATTPVDPEVFAAMRPYFEDRFGNPGSAHEKGTQAAQALAAARACVAAAVNCAPEEVVFTGCATEANNLLIKGLALAIADGRKPAVVVSSIEHPSVQAPAEWLRARGFPVVALRVDGEGLVDPEELRRALPKDTLLVSVMHANNETGAIQPIAELAAVCGERGVLFHSDCSQSAGKIPVDLAGCGIDFATFAGHKVYVPKGVGALARRAKAPIEPMWHGGGQEQGLRPGTENVAYAVGIGAGFERATAMMPAEPARWCALRDRLHEILADEGAILNGPAEARLPNTLNVSFAGVSGQAILQGAPVVLASTGAACHSHGTTISAVLRAMGIGEHRGMGALRLTLGRGTTLDQIEEAGAALVQSVRRLRPA